MSTDRQTDKLTNATKNITSFAKEVKNHRQSAYLIIIETSVSIEVYIVIEGVAVFFSISTSHLHAIGNARAKSSNNIIFKFLKCTYD